MFPLYQQENSDLEELSGFCKRLQSQIKGAEPGSNSKALSIM